MNKRLLYCNLPVYEACYRLTLEFAKVRGRLSRDVRYTLGQDLQRALVELLTLIYRANATRNKVPVLAEARRVSVQVQIYLRLLSDLHCISDRQFVELFELAVSVAKQFTSWHRAEHFGDAKSASENEGPECGGSRSAAVRRQVNSINASAPLGGGADEGGLTSEVKETLWKG